MAVNVGTLVATTLRDRNKELADTVTKHNALLYKLDKGGSIKEVSQGGRTIFEPLFYGSNSSVKFYDGTETFTPDVVGDVVDGSEWAWKQLGGFVAISGKELAMNRGKAAVIDLLEARIKHLKANLRNTAAASLYSDGTGSGGKEFGGLKLLIADAPSGAGIVGGIDQQANAFWRNKVSASAVFNSANALSRMNALWLQTIRGTEQADLILTDAEMYGQYEGALQPLQRFTDSKMADAGFENYKYKGAQVVYDENCPARRMYFVNTDALSFKYAPDRWFKADEARVITNADYEVVPIWTMGNLLTNDRARHGVIISSGIA